MANSTHDGDDSRVRSHKFEEKERLTGGGFWQMCYVESGSSVATTSSDGSSRVHSPLTPLEESASLSEGEGAAAFAATATAASTSSDEMGQTSSNLSILSRKSTAGSHSVSSREVSNQKDEFHLLLRF